MGRIIVADDNMAIREVIRQILDQHDIVQACNGEEVIATLTHDDWFDLLILDIEMPVTNGWETLAVIRDDDNGWPKLPVITMSISKEPESALKAWAYGATHYLVKPLNTGVLCGVVDDVLGLVLPPH